MSPMTPGVGGVLGGRYTLTERIAAGGMGDVWAATDQVLGRTVAIKIMRPNTTDEGNFAARFRDEARHTAALSHPNIAAVYDYGEDDGTAYLVMELVPGVPLSTIIAEGPMPPEQVRLILGQCALALAAAHEAGVVHRDVKPANVMVTPEGKVKLTDFGIARAVDAVGHTRTGEVMGTPQYLAPEQAMGQRVTGATDLYSLGVVGHEMLTGKRPFDAGSAVATALAQISEPPPPLPPHVTDPLRSAIEACLVKDPAQRPSSAASLAALLGMPVSGVAHASPATSVIPLSDLGATQPLDVPTPMPTEVYGQQPSYPPHGRGAAYPAQGPYATQAPYPPQHAAAFAEPQPPTRRRGLGWWWLPVLAALLVAGLFIWQNLVASGTGSTPIPAVTVTRTIPRTNTTATTTTTTTTKTSSATPSTSAVKDVAIVESDYVGQTAGVVRSDLTTLGFLDVTTKSVTSDRPKGEVLGISPTGSVPVTTTIVIRVSAGAAPTSSSTSTGGSSG
jgi:serine/threonine-protein kinase